ncbi:MAG: 16S rRNA (uracil(1498)-N(3))-methyltransferase [Acidobacteria bacterium]|nr:16S rRNA (uracil(1498)-N(3))-methyltransferase [Acidobacteriota bacterium]MBV9622370.1 16S rRNA (uracil(1498)-N(3))-methyltransferase [Acidobacteriota bacterium]
MTRRRWIADEVRDNRAFLIGKHARHLRTVLRAEVGQQFEISLGAEVRQGRITSIRPDRVEFELGEPVVSFSSLPLSIAVAIFKFDRMEWAIEKSTELGVSRILPVVSARTEPHLARAAVNRLERWRRIAAQAAEQSRRIRPPDIFSPMKFAQLPAAPAETRIALAETGDDLRFEDALSPVSSSLLLAFGPEGGWKDQELAEFRKSGWKLASLGPAILRSETAIIAAVAIAGARHGSWHHDLVDIG